MKDITELKRLASPAPKPQSLAWDGADSRGERLAAGVYFIALDAAGDHQGRKVILTGTE